MQVPRAVRAQLLSLYCRRMARTPATHHLLFRTHNASAIAATAAAAAAVARGAPTHDRRLTRRRLRIARSKGAAVDAGVDNDEGHGRVLRYMGRRDKISGSSAADQSFNDRARRRRLSRQKKAFLPLVKHNALRRPKDGAQALAAAEEEGAAGEGGAAAPLVSEGGLSEGPSGGGALPLPVGPPLRIVVHARRGDRVSASLRPRLLGRARMEAVVGGMQQQQRR